MGGRTAQFRLLMCAGAALFAAGVAQGAQFTVTNFFDSGSGSLREAINLANTTPGADTIVFNFNGQGFPPPPYLLYLNTPLPTVTEDLRIVGPGASTMTVAPAENFAGFIILPVSGAMSLTIEELQFSRGAGTRGGAIGWNGSGSLTVRGCVFTRCSASDSGGAIDFRGSGSASVTIANSAFIENSAESAGGAISVSRTGGQATMSVTATTFDRSAVKLAAPGTRGGAIAILGTGGPNTLTVTGSTFVSNAAPQQGLGGAIAIDGHGGSLSLTNSTFFGNSAGDGSVVHGADAPSSVLQCTITSNSATSPTGTTTFSMAGAGTLNCVNTIISGNSAGPAFRDFSNAQSVSGNHNVVGVGSTFVHGVSGNIVGVTDPKVAPLNQIGGMTPTLALRPDSPALDSGSNADAPATDQRGQPRPADGDNNNVSTADIGAFETQKFLVNTTANEGAGSLREAISANNLAGGGFIRFAIPGAGSTRTIAPTTQLPSSLRPVFLDGWSQGGPAYIGPPLIELSGANLGAQAVGFDQQGSDSILRGLAFNSFRGGSTDTGWGLLLRSRTGIRNWVYGCYMGVGLDGTTPRLNDQAGLAIYLHANQNFIGSNGDGVNDAAERNVIAGSSASGVRCAVYVGSNSNIIAGNHINAFAPGTSSVGTPNYGVWIDAGAANNRIGTSIGDAFPQAGRNLIVGAAIAGVRVTSGNGAGNSVTGNFIGVASGGGNALPNAIGVLVNNSITTVIGGDHPALGNLISGNTSHAISIAGAQSVGCVVQGNVVGLNSAGTNSLANGGSGLVVSGGATFTRIGTLGDSTPTDAARRNVFSANLAHGVIIQDLTTTQTQFMGNYVGTGTSGSGAFGNAMGGVRVLDCPGVAIGGPGLQRNVVCASSGSGAPGIELSGPGTIQTSILNNLIGQSLTGAPLGNNGPGIRVSNGSTNNSIGGTSTGDGNVIAHNGAGVVVIDDTSVTNRILGNSIHSNSALGIDLANNGVTPNGPALTTRTGPNHLQNHPFIHSVSSSGVVTVSLFARANAPYRIEVFSSQVADATGYGEGRTFLGSIDAVTDSAGWTGQLSFSAPVNAGEPFYTATATDLGTNVGGSVPAGAAALGDTSEFSQARRINTGPTADPQVVSSLEDTDSTITLGVSDADAGAGLMARLTSLPSSGTLLQFGTLTPIVSANTNVTDTQRRVVFRPAGNQFGLAYANFEFAASDGIEQSPPASVTVNVSPVADTPSITGATTIEAIQTTSGLVVSRNAADGAEVTHFKITGVTGGTLFLNDGVTPVAINSFITSAQGQSGLRFTPASANVGVTPNAHTPLVTHAQTNEDVMTSSGLVITPGAGNGAEVTHFKIVSLSKGSLFRADGTTPVSVGEFITTSVGAAGLRYRPEPDDFGSVDVQIAASLSATDAGIANSPATATITILPVNDSPSFIASNPPTVLVLGVPVTINNWASFSPGPANEGDQTVLAYSVSSVSNGALFSVAPAISGAGTLSFTPAPGATGTSTFQVRVRDSGGTDRGGVDQSPSQTFTITVLPANQPPSFTAMDPPAVLESSGEHAVSGFITSFTPGPPIENDQTVLEYIVDQVSNPSLFVTQPRISVNGRLTYTLSGVGFGTSTFRVFVRDSGGTERGGVDLSAPQTFTIIVRPAAVCRNITIDSRVTCDTRVVTLSDLNATPSNAGPGATQSVDSTHDFTQPFPIGTRSVPVRVTYSDGLISSCLARVTVLGDDCNGNGVPDSCDIGGGASSDCNADGVPDECQCLWDNGAVPTGGAAQSANGQLSHLGGGIPEGAKVADDFYLPPGAAYKIFGFQGAMLTNTLPSLRKARLEFYDDCDGMPAALPFKTYQSNVILRTEPSQVGFDLVTYSFSFCTDPLILEGDKSYWVSLIGLTDNQGGDSSYWVSATPFANPGAAMGSGPRKAFGLPGSTWNNYVFEPWSEIDDCCLGCVNFVFGLRGEVCPLIWDNGGPDLTAPAAGYVSGANRGQFPSPRAADNFVVKPCSTTTVCMVETFIFTDCNPVAGFLELYANDCRRPIGTPLFTAVPKKVIPTGHSIVVDGVTYPGYKLVFDDLGWSLEGGKDYWVSTGSNASGGLNLRSFSAWASNCNRPCVTQISPSMSQETTVDGRVWNVNARDLAFRIYRKPDPAIMSGTTGNGNAAPTCRADIDGDGLNTVQDVFEFLARWFVGCP